MDDIIVTCSDQALINKLKQLLDSTFKIKDLGNLSYFLGTEAPRYDARLNLRQRKYTLDILEECSFLNSKLVDSPMVPSQKLTHDDGTLLKDISGYIRLVGPLFYLTTTRPNIAYVTQQLNQFIDKPIENYLNAAYRVLRYLKGTQGKAFSTY